jgi:hypothetical protein
MYVQQIDQTSLVLPRSMLVDPYTYGKQLEAYRRWIVGTAMEVVKARNASVPVTRISVDAFEVVEFEIELAHVNIFLLANAKLLYLVMSASVKYSEYCNQDTLELAGMY